MVEAAFLACAALVLHDCPEVPLPACLALLGYFPRIINNADVPFGGRPIVEPYLQGATLLAPTQLRLYDGCLQNFPHTKPHTLRRFAPSVNAFGLMPRSSAGQLVGSAIGNIGLDRGE